MQESHGKSQNYHETTMVFCKCCNALLTHGCSTGGCASFVCRTQKPEGNRKTGSLEPVSALPPVNQVVLMFTASEVSCFLTEPEGQINEGTGGWSGITKGELISIVFGCAGQIRWFCTATSPSSQPRKSWCVFAHVCAILTRTLNGSVCAFRLNIVHPKMFAKEKHGKTK